ncbi:MAG: hypothetical protein CL489_10915 [Acidobacteria bacterium]|nr:hypothetical protein [Acidobacteriota bacterium]|tara:strand:- start:743 stop:1126 length:384 start_codon:yes stop_codon:yes gene_type:complete
MSNTLDNIVQVHTIASQIVGFELYLMIPVFVLVSVLSRVLKIRSKYPNSKSWMLGLLCLLVAIIVAYFNIEKLDYKTLMKMSISLGATSALTYQIFKKFFKSIILRLANQFKKKTGQGVDIVDEDFL